MATTIEKLSFVVRTGNLPLNVSMSAVQHANVEAFAAWQKTPVAVTQDGMRVHYIGYKVTSKMLKELSDGDVVSANFSVSLPALRLADLLPVDDDALTREGSPWADNAKFLHGLMMDYQNALVKASADKETKVNPTDLQAVVKDYLSTERTRIAPTVAEVDSWLKDEWSVAYATRILQLNETAPAEGRKVWSEKEATGLIERYGDLIQKASKATCNLNRHNLTSTRQNLEKLQELGLLKGSDTIASFLVERVKAHIVEWDAQNNMEEDTV